METGVCGRWSDGWLDCMKKPRRVAGVFCWLGAVAHGLEARATVKGLLLFHGGGEDG